MHVHVSNGWYHVLCAFVLAPLTSPLRYPPPSRPPSPSLTTSITLDAARLTLPLVSEIRFPVRRARTLHGTLGSAPVSVRKASNTGCTPMHQCKA